MKFLTKNDLDFFSEISDNFIVCIPSSEEEVESKLLKLKEKGYLAYIESTMYSKYTIVVHEQNAIIHLCGFNSQQHSSL